MIYISVLISELKEQRSASTSNRQNLGKSSQDVQILTRHLLGGDQLLWALSVVWLFRFRESNKSWPQCQLCLCKSLKLSALSFPTDVKCSAQHQAENRCSLEDTCYYEGDSDDTRHGLTEHRSWDSRSCSNSDESTSSALWGAGGTIVIRYLCLLNFSGVMTQCHPAMWFLKGDFLSRCLPPNFSCLQTGRHFGVLDVIYKVALLRYPWVLIV